MSKLHPSDLPTFKLFSRGYWGQMGPEEFGTFAAAFERFVADVRKTAGPTEYFANLLLELQEVRRRGFVLKLDGVESPEVWEFWTAAGGRGLSMSEFDYAENFLRELLST